MEYNFDQIFESSYGRVMQRGAYNPEFIDGFYRRFLASEDVARRFARTDMARQKTMLHDSLQTLVQFSRSRRLTPQLARLARVHSRGEQDIPPGLYERWLDSLMETVAEFDPQFDQTVELCWRLTLAPGISYLQFGYEHPPA
jgi:hypothetical protein